jgi:SAM-dependent methyltransferase
VSSAEGRTYALGHSERELERLRVQASLIEPITRRFFVDAGIGAGMRVLDVGSGAGDVAFLVAELVGETGKVVGVDRVPAPLITARQRARARAVTNVSFLDGDPTEMSFDQRFDAVVGRYVLMYQPDPSATIRTLVTHLRPGAVVVFHEPYRDGIRSFPPVPSYDRAWQLVDETLRRTGGDTTMGIKLHAAFVGAGLAPPSMRLESIIAGGASCSDHLHLEVDPVAALLPEMERLGIATADEVDAETMAERVLAEAIATESVIVGRAEVAAWTRV